MPMNVRWLALCFSLTAVMLEGCAECSDCDQGPIPVAYVRVRTSSSVGSVPGVAVQLERNGFVPLSAATDALGEYTFEALEAGDGDRATLIVTPPSGYAMPALRVLSLVMNDTLDVEVVLEPEP